MVKEYCPTCNGIGSYLGQKWVQDETGISIYWTVAVRKPCEMCHGEGRLKKPESLNSPVCNFRPTGRPSRWAVGSLGIEQALGYLIFCALVGYASVLLVRGNSAPANWLKVAVALEAALVLVFMLRHFPKSSPALRWSTVGIFFVLLCAGVAWEYAR